MPPVSIPRTGFINWKEKPTHTIGWVDRQVSIPRTGFINWKGYVVIDNSAPIILFQSRERVSLIGKSTNQTSPVAKSL